MAKDQPKSKINRAMVSPESSYPTKASPGYSSTARTQGNDLKSNLRKMVKAFKEEINKYKETQENILKIR